MQCINSPVVASLKLTTMFDTLEPVAVPLRSGKHVAWTRLLPADMDADDIAAVLHRSHHAMAILHADSPEHDGTKTQGDLVTPSAAANAPIDGTKEGGALYLLWGGYGSTMTVLDDLWVVQMQPAAQCGGTNGRNSADGAWCWTGRRVQQHNAPPGRAYAKLVPLKVRPCSRAVTSGPAPHLPWSRPGCAV